MPPRRIIYFVSKKYPYLMRGCCQRDTPAIFHLDVIGKCFCTIYYEALLSNVLIVYVWCINMYLNIFLNLNLNKMNILSVRLMFLLYMIII